MKSVSIWHFLYAVVRFSFRLPMMSSTRKPRISLSRLRLSYDSLGPLEELPGERTFLGRCSTWEGFLEYGPILADMLAGSDVAVPPGPQGRALARLAREAWGQTGGTRQR